MDDRTCRDCGTTDGLSWWEGKPGYKTAATSRCRPCYNAYCKSIYRRRHGLPAEGPTRQRKAYQPRPPIPCAECGAEFHRVNQSRRCPACRLAHEEKRRGRTGAVRLAARNAGDRSIHWRPLGERDGWRCHICGGKVQQKPGTAHEPKGATVDHLVPIADGGEHEWHNVALAHRRCNISRGARGTTQLRLVG